MLSQLKMHVATAKTDEALDVQYQSKVSFVIQYNSMRRSLHFLRFARACMFSMVSYSTVSILAPNLEVFVNTWKTLWCMKPWLSQAANHKGKKLWWATCWFQIQAESKLQLSLSKSKNKFYKFSCCASCQPVQMFLKSLYCNAMRRRHNVWISHVCT